MTTEERGEDPWKHEFDPDPGWLRAKPGMKWRAVPADTLAAWVADMDFPTPPPVRDALHRLVAEGDLGYPAWLHGDTPLREAFAARMAERYGWRPDPAHVREFTDIIQALQVVLHVATSPGDTVALHTPAYPPFLAAIPRMGRRLLPIPVERHAEGWRFDAARFAAEAARSGCRALVLVNPHNPTGRAFDVAELSELAEVADAQDLLVISDEIHAELTFPPHRHVPFASLGPQAAARTVTLTSATKAFNLAGIRCAVAHVGAASVREALAAQPPFLFGDVGAPGVVATLAAWRQGDAWLAAAMKVLAGNRDIIGEILGPHGVGYDPPQATYLAWLDFRGLGLGDDPATALAGRARVKLSPGPDFGAAGAGFARLNFATSPAVLTEICERIAAALNLR